jgi:hypothetical protein
MRTPITQVSFGETQLLRVAEFDEEWPLSMSVKYEENARRPLLVYGNLKTCDARCPLTQPFCQPERVDSRVTAISSKLGIDVTKKLLGEDFKPSGRRLSG